MVGAVVSTPTSGTRPPFLIVFKYRNALDEWASGVLKTVKLESDDYGEVYDAILDGLETVEQHEIDGPALCQRLASWAGIGASVPS